MSPPQIGTREHAPPGSFAATTGNLTLACLGTFVLAACSPAILPQDHVLDLVPERVVGARPVYATPPLPAARWSDLVPDSLAPEQVFETYAFTVVPYRAVALWRVDASSSPPRFSLGGTLDAPGLLRVGHSADSMRLTIYRAADTYRLDLTRYPYVLSGPHPTDRPPLPFDFVRAPAREACGCREVYLECPDPDSLLVGFVLAELQDPPRLLGF